ncbi:AAA domain [Bacteriophage sp.]|nr:AAA domain [Bacteriophage sp.]UOF80139.1 AAA domain [Bacteriophage sp.]
MSRGTSEQTVSKATKEELPRRARGGIGIYAPPGHGKTFAALTCSAYWEESRLAMLSSELAKLEPIHLADTLLVAADQGATDGVRSFRMWPDELDLFMEVALDKDGVGGVAARIVKLLRTHIKPAHRYLVVDTVSQINNWVVQYWDENCPITGNGHRDTKAMWPRVEAMLTKFHSAFTMIAAANGMRTIFTYHPVANFAPDTSSDMGKAAAVAREVGGIEGKMRPSVTGKAYTGYFGAATYMFWLEKRTRMEGRLQKEERYLVGDSDTHTTKNRLSHLVGNDFRANLRALFKIEGDNIIE